ncbi:small-conductance mechanosensitive channel [Virgibacillus salexigens]|uniref:small-conductance mechanosensitive channel n=1 Tax=Virgibacillus salexigens TaxID=61016 RepID=UPI0030813BFB
MEVSEKFLHTERIKQSETIKMSEFHAKSHFWGRITIWTIIGLTLSLPICLSFVLGYHPGWPPILSGLTAYIAVIGLVWVVEPISYFPTLGVSGTYLAFLTGNISNMCLPSAGAAQLAVGTDPGTKKGEIVATLAIGAASLVNLAILTVIIISGSFIVSMLPDSVRAIFPYIVPAIFGGIFVQFAIKKPLYGCIALTSGLLIYLLPIPSFFKGLCCIVITISLCIFIEKRKHQQSHA